MVGKTISHYKILEKIGEGGMGVVYKTEDTKLKRTVALKFLPPELTRDAEAKERFIHEAQAASALQHSNVCNIHDIDETSDGQMFIVMDCYEGESLKEKITRGRMNLEEAINIAVQIASGLSKAHEREIVHRDIKPANIFITADGTVKILDFGIAKLSGGRTKLTKAGSTLGTAAYMSPEQARGEEVNHQTDIWSLGVVLYEMITGQLPFKSEYGQALVYSILNDDVPPVKQLRENVPSALEHTIARCLEKEKTKRYQNAAQVVGALREIQQEIVLAIKERKKIKKIALIIGGGIIVLVIIVLAYFFLLPKSVPTQEKSIAVLPFVDMSPQKDQEYFCDGMTEELINRLSNIQELRVPARTSAFVFKGKTGDIQEIGSKLKVQTVLEGSVRKAGNELRITAQLINVVDGYHLWSEKYDRELKDVFTIQDEISSAIVDALRLKLTSQEKKKISERQIDNAVAYECYLRANYEIGRYKEDALDRAVQDLQNALDISGPNPLLYSAMAYAYWQYVNIGVKQEDYLARAEEYANKALTIDPEFSQAHMILGLMSMARNLKEGIRYFNSALAANPNEPNTLAWIITAYISIGKPSAALPFIERLNKTDPLNPFNYSTQGGYYLMDGQFGPALEPFRKFYQSDPSSPVADFLYSQVLAYNKKFDESFSIIDKCAEADPNNVISKFGLLLKYGLKKDKKRALLIMTPDFRKTCQRDGEWSYYVADAFALLDEKKEALDWLENAVDHSYFNYPFINEYDTFLKNIRGEERFKNLMVKVKYKWEHFEE